MHNNLGLSQFYDQILNFEPIKIGGDVHTSRRISDNLLSANISSFDCQKKRRRHHKLESLFLILQINWTLARLYWLYDNTDYSGKFGYVASQLLCDVWDLLHASNDQPARWKY